MNRNCTRNVLHEAICLHFTIYDNYLYQESVIDTNCVILRSEIGPPEQCLILGREKNRKNPQVKGHCTVKCE